MYVEGWRGMSVVAVFEKVNGVEGPEVAGGKRWCMMEIVCFGDSKIAERYNEVSYTMIYKIEC